MARPTKVITWNANGVADRRNELLHFLTDHDVDVVLVTETHLQPRHRFNLPAYVCYRDDRPPNPANPWRNPMGGTAVLVHRRLPHRRVDTPNISFEATGVAIGVDGAEVLLVAAYSPPGSPLPPRDLDTFLDTPGPVIIGGDLNAKHTSWYSRSNNIKGTRLCRYISRRDDTTVAAPVDPTHFPSNAAHAPDVLDIFLLKDVDFLSAVDVIDDLSSDHAPVLLTLHSSPTLRAPPGHLSKRTDWRKYNSLLSDLQPPPPAPDPNTLDEQVEALHSALANAVSAATRPAPPRDTRSSLPPCIMAEITEKRRLRRVWQQTRTPDSKRLLNRQCERVKALLRDHRAASWDTFLESLDVQDGGVWRVAKSLRGDKPSTHPLHGQRGLVYSAEARAEVFADTMEDQFKPHADVYDDATEEEMEVFMENFFSTPPPDNIQPITLDELREAAAALKPRKAPGHDGLGAKALLSAPPILLPSLLSLFNSSLRLLHFPPTWKTAKVILLRKPKQSPLFPQNYRPISLLPTISKLLEKLLLSRISPHLEGFFRPEQFGFRRGHSTTLQLVRVVSKLVDAANHGRATAAVMLDVSKAFDRVWHPGLLYKLSRTPLPVAYVHLLRSYLQERTFRTSVEGQASTLRPIEAGVPQGSVLGPVLYLVYTNDLPTIPNVTLSLYADDAMMHCSSIHPARAAATLQQQLTVLTPWLKRWRIKINAGKSDAILFKKFRRMPRVRPPELTLGGSPIPWRRTVRYLGVTLDTGLNFGAHAQRKVVEARGVQALLRPLLTQKSPLPLPTKVLIFLAIVRSALTYAAPAWWALLSRTNKALLERIQSKGLRRICGQPWMVRNSTIRNGLHLPTIGEFVRGLAQKMHERAAERGAAFEVIWRRDGPPETHRPRPQALLDDPP